MNIHQILSNRLNFDSCLWIKFKRIVKCSIFSQEFRQVLIMRIKNINQGVLWLTEWSIYLLFCEWNWIFTYKVKFAVNSIHQQPKVNWEIGTEIHRRKAFSLRFSSRARWYFLERPLRIAVINTKNWYLKIIRGIIVMSYGRRKWISYLFVKVKFYLFL